MALNELERKYELEYTSNKNKIVCTIQQIVRKVTNIDSVQIVVNDIEKHRVSVNFSITADLGRDEANDLSLDYESDYDWTNDCYAKPELKLSTGSYGAISRARRPAVVIRDLLTAELWKHEQELVMLFASLSFEARDAYKTAYYAEQKAIAATKKAEEEKKTAEIEASLVPGTVYKSDKANYSRMNEVYEIIKVSSSKNTKEPRVYLHYSGIDKIGDSDYDISYDCYVLKASLVYLLREGKTIFDLGDSRFHSIKNFTYLKRKTGAAE